MYYLVFYPEKKIGTNFTRILQNEETEAQRFIHLFVHRPLTNTKAMNPQKAFSSGGYILTAMSERYVISSCFEQRHPWRKGVEVGLFVGMANSLKNQGGV